MKSCHIMKDSASSDIVKSFARDTVVAGSSVLHNIGKMSFTLEVAPLGDEAKSFAEKELRENPEVVKKGLEELRELVKNDQTLSFDTDDEFLMIFLRPCKFYAESAYKLMKRYAEFKRKYADLVENLLPEDEKEAFFKSNVVNVLKNRDHKGRRVLLQHCGSKWNPSEASADQVFRMLYLIHEAAVLEPETQVRGIVVLLDFDGLSTKQVMALSPTVSLRLLSFIQDVMPLRLKEVHIVKQPFIFNLVWNIFKPFIKDKLKKRLFFHGSKMSSLHSHLDPSYLPKDYGGQLPEINYTGADWYPTIEKHMEKIIKMNEWGLAKK